MFNDGGNQKLKAWSFQLLKNYFYMLNIERPKAHQSLITFFLYTLYNEHARELQSLITFFDTACIL